MNTKSVTMQAIADKLGITKVSVSKAMSDQPGISEELKRRILEVARELGYKKGREKSPGAAVKRLGFLVSKRFFLESDKFYTMIYYYLGRECAQKDISLLLYIVGSGDERNLTLPFSLQQDSLDGLFIAGEIDDSYVRVLLDVKIPTIAIDFYKPQYSLDCIVTDNFYSSYLATLHLIHQGHRQIGFVGNPNYTASVMDRFYGYQKALTQSGLEYRKEWHLENNDQAGIYTMDNSLPDVLPTAFLCHCDMAAYHLLLKLRSQGIAIPGQVSLVSFDNTDLCGNCSPTLTSVDISKKEIAHKSLHQMLWRIVNTLAEPQRILLNTHLIQRDSVQKIG